MASLDRVNPLLASRFLALQRAAAAAGFQVGVGSAWRDPAEQARLRIKNGCPDIHVSPSSSCRIPTARPGHSPHQKGLAIDVAANAAAKAWIGQNAARFGLHLPVDGEDWHLELIGDAGSQGHLQGAGFDPATYMEGAVSPEDSIDERLQALMGAMVGAQRDTLVEMTGRSMLETPSLEAELVGTSTVPELNVETDPFAAKSFGRPVATGAKMAGGIPPPGYAPPGKGVERWRPIALAALRYTGQPESWVDLLLQRMNQESGGNHTIVNNWDSNAKRGDPSKGLMQNIGSAFPDRARELTSRGIYDGFANIVASIRYTLDRYGTLSAWGRPGGY